MTLHIYGKRRVSGTVLTGPSHVRLEATGDVPAFMRPRIERAMQREALRLLGRARI